MNYIVEYRHVTYAHEWTLWRHCRTKVCAKICVWHFNFSLGWAHKNWNVRYRDLG